ncbi:MAG: ubiquinol-cytochrome c reductase iron-sulfur subunit [Mariprofundus sp.]
MNIHLNSDVIDKESKTCGHVSRLIANQASRQIEQAVVHLNSGREIMLSADAFTSEPEDRLRVAMTESELATLTAFDISIYYPLHPVEWQEEWGAVKGEILSLYPPMDIDPKSRRRFIIGSFAIIGAIAASLVYPIARYLLYPLSKGLPKLWTRLTTSGNMEEDQPVFVAYKVHRIEGYLEETIPKGVWLIKPSRTLANQVAARRHSMQFTEVGWANRKGDIVAFTPKCPHLGCNVHWDGDQKAFLCPCHGSRFSIDGSVTDGPAPRGLDTLPVRMQADKVEVMDMEFRAGIDTKKRSA